MNGVVGVKRMSEPRRRHGVDSGAAAVEFAMILPVLLLLIFGIIQYGYYFFAAQNGSSVLREATRKVVVGKCVTDGELEAYVANRLGGLAYDNLVVTRTYDPAREIGATVTVFVSFDTLNMNLPFIPVPGNATVAREADGRMEDLTPGVTPC